MWSWVVRDNLYALEKKGIKEMEPFSAHFQFWKVDGGKILE